MFTKERIKEALYVKKPIQSHCPNLTREIVDGILLRLPVKTLLRFRCGCKSWRSLISDPKFTKTHLSLASSNTDYTHHRLLLSSVDNPRDFMSCSVFSIMYEQCDAALRLDFPYYPFEETPNGDWIVGSCDGLVCVAVRSKKLFLWNPSTRKCRILPGIKEFEMPRDRYTTHYECFRFPVLRVHGFGFDESIDDYKVVLIVQTRFNYREYQATVAVYTLRTNSWRRIRDCPHLLDANASGKFASGALHWIGRVGIKDIIVSLDLAKETYGEVLQPDSIDSKHDLTIDVLGGCLCMLCRYDGLGVDLWVMKKYGIRESWTKLVAIYDVAHILACRTDFAPKCILKNGNVLLDVPGVRGRLVQYNPKDGKLWYPKIHECFPSFNSAYPYIESLVSPYTDSGV